MEKVEDETVVVVVVVVVAAVVVVAVEEEKEEEEEEVGAGKERALEEVKGVKTRWSSLVQHGCHWWTRRSRIRPRRGSSWCLTRPQLCSPSTRCGTGPATSSAYSARRARERASS